MKKQFVTHLTTVFAVVFFLSMIPLAGQAADGGKTLQQFSQSVEDIVKEVTPSIVRIKVDGRQKGEERRYFEEYFPPGYRWRWDKPDERYFEPKRFQFFFNTPEKNENSSQYKKREFYFSIPRIQMSRNSFAKIPPFPPLRKGGLGGGFARPPYTST